MKQFLSIFLITKKSFGIGHVCTQTLVEMTTSVFFPSVWQSEGVLTKVGENLRLSPSKKGRQNMDVHTNKGW